MGLTPLWLSSASAYSCSALLWWSRRLVKMHSLEFGETINEVLSWRGHRRCSLPLGQKSLVVVIYLSGCYGIFPSSLYSSLHKLASMKTYIIYWMFCIRPLSWIDPTLSLEFELTCSCPLDKIYRHCDLSVRLLRNIPVRNVFLVNPSNDNFRGQPL